MNETKPLVVILPGFRLYQVSMAPRRTPSGEMPGVVLLLRDITRLRGKVRKI
jgi:hypothetical protein